VHGPVAESLTRRGGCCLTRRLLRLACAALLAGAAGCAGDGSGEGGRTATVTPTIASTPVPTPTAIPTAVPTSAPTPTSTIEPTATSVPTAVPTSAPTASPTVQGGPIAMRRLTTAQYKASIADVLGADIVVAGRIEPDNRRSGLLAVGSSFVSVTSAGFEQYEAIARNVAEQALDPAHRDALVPCSPQAATQPDDDCAEQFIRQVGDRLLRRPGTDHQDIALRVGIARDAAAALGDFYGGLETALTALLLSPEFLFRVEMAEPDPDDPNRQRLTDASMAARLSYFLWNTTPDDELLAAAQHGELVDDAGLETQVDRLLESDRLNDATRAFFSDLYGFDAIEEGLVRKDPTLFPAFSQALITDAREQTLRVVTDHLLARDGDYRELFTTRRSFMTRTLGVVYQVPVRSAVGWEPFEFPAGGERAGLLTHVSLLALHSHPGRSSPTLRGKFVREVLLCTDVPPPPGDIDFSEFAEEGGANRRTARERLAVHVADQVCSGCHGLMDPIGLALEKLDGIGILRETENGAAIDPSGELNGVPFADAPGLGEVLSQDPGLGPCFVESLYKYAVGRDVAPGERAWLADVETRLAESGYRLRDLMRIIAMSEAFRTTSGARAAEATVTPSSGTTPVGTPIPSATARPTDGSEPTPTSSGNPPATGSVPPTPEPTATPRGFTFQQIQDQIFTPRCATQYCHGQQARSGNLVLEAGEAYGNLVGVAPTNVAARTAGMLRVDPFAPENSFLILKLSQPSSRDFGSRMPLIGAPLSADEIGSISDWILAGPPP
jgi:Protein of unknown function (DUF1592)/Protein of unknown function (DUF1588)/Protein of unknown function (DUF1585)/Protein of unknown function (DUF1595)/Protein of unknown function (DUF1587)